MSVDFKINTYMLVESDSIGNNIEVAKSVLLALEPRDFNYKLISWAHIYETYHKFGAVWFDDNRQRFVEVADWCMEKNDELTRRVDDLRPRIGKWIKDESKFETPVLMVANRLILDVGEWTPISMFRNEIGDLTIVDFYQQIQDGEDFSGHALVPLTINLRDSWIYNEDGLRELFEGLDQTFVIPTF